MIDFASGMAGLLVTPLGSKRTWQNLLMSTFIGTPYCSMIETAVAKLSIRPLTMDPSLAIEMNISPGRPFGYRPTVMYPSWPAIENLWVTACRSSGRRTRCGAGGPSASSGFSLPVLNGWMRLLPSR